MAKARDEVGFISLNIGYLTSNRSVAGDECWTPFYAVDPLLEFIPKDKIIWCPFDEKWSAFYRTFKEQGYQVIRSSLSEGQDFFTYEPQGQWDVLVSNPPFSQKDKVLERAYDFKRPFALLLPANSIQGKKRFKIFKNQIQMLCFDARIDFHIKNDFEHYTTGTAFGSAYFCKDLLPSKLELRKLNKYERSLKINEMPLQN